MIRSEQAEATTAALATLDEETRELLILRGVEGHSYSEIAVVLGRDADNLRMQYVRALAKLHAALPGALADDLAEP